MSIAADLKALIVMSDHAFSHASQECLRRSVKGRRLLMPRSPLEVCGAMTQQHGPGPGTLVGASSGPVQYSERLDAGQRKYEKNNVYNRLRQS
jgi:hypothetical protein